MSEKEIDPLESGNGWIRYDHNTKKWVKSPENERLIKKQEELEEDLITDEDIDDLVNEE